MASEARGKGKGKSHLWVGFLFFFCTLTTGCNSETKWWWLVAPRGAIN